MREGSPALAGGKELGVLTSATTVPAWRFQGNCPGREHYLRPLGLALLASETPVGQEVEIHYRKLVLPGRVVSSFTQLQCRYLKPIEFEGGAR